MATPTAKQMFLERFGDRKNFMTEQVIRYGKLRIDLAYELSTGMFGPTRLWGVSVIQRLPDGSYQRPQGWNGPDHCHTSREAAEADIAAMKEQV